MTGGDSEAGEARAGEKSGLIKKSTRMRDNPPLPRKSLGGTRSIVSGDDGEMQESQASHHFSIRGYVSEVRKIDRNKCWPFSPMNELPDSLPPMILPNFRWWGCKSCLCMNDQIEKDSESMIPNASKRDEWISEGQLSPIEENQDPLDEREDDVDQERNILNSILPNASKSCLYRIDEIDKDSNSILPNASKSCLYRIDEIDKDSNSILPNALKRDDRISEGQLSLIEENQDSLHERENDEDQDCNIHDSTTATVDLGGESFETDLPAKSGNNDYIAVENDGVLGSISSVKRIKFYYTRRPRKLRTLADIMKNEALCPSGERNLPKKDQISQKRQGIDNTEDNPFGDERSVPQFGEMKFPSWKRRYCPGGERKGFFSFKILLKRSEKPKTRRLGRVRTRAKKLEDLKEIKANISKDRLTTTADTVVPECEASIPYSQDIGAPTEKRSVEVETGVSKEYEIRDSARTLDREEKAAVNETKSILDDVPIEILELLQSNFQMKHQQNLGHSTAYLDRSPGIDNEPTDSRVSYLRDQSIPGGGESSTLDSARRRKKPKKAKDGPFISAQNKPIEAHLDPDPFPAPYPCRCYSKVNSYAGLISEKGNYESGSKETLSAMQLLRLMDPAVPLSLKRDVGSFDSFVAQNRATPDQASSPGMTSLNSFTTFGNFPSLDGRERLSSNSREKRRFKNPDSAGRQGNNSTSNSIQFEFKNKGGADDPLRGGQPELGFCALNMNPADFYIVNARSKLYMISYKDLRPKTKKQPAVCPDLREREMLPAG